MTPATREAMGAIPTRQRVMAALVVFVGLYALGYGLLHGLSVSPRFADFFGLWSFGRFALSHQAAEIYDPTALKLFQHGLDPQFSDAYPFFYPPSFLFVTIPLALLPLIPAWACWGAAQLVVYVAAVAGRGWRSWAGVALLAAPPTLLCLVAGQSGLLTGAMLLGGLLVMPRRAVLGGVLLGLLTFKPQLGLLLPVALLAAGQWRATAAAALTALLLAGATALVFGLDAWLVWLRTIHLGTELVLRNRGGLIGLMPTVSAGLLQLDAPQVVIGAVQGATTLAAAVATWFACRRGLGADAIAATMVAGLLATPYAFVYDMPAVSGGLILSIAARPTELRSALLFALTAIAPLALVSMQAPLVEPVLLAASLWVLVRRASCPPSHPS